MTRKAIIEIMVRKATTMEMYFIARLENILTKVPIKSAARVPIKMPFMLARFLWDTRSRQLESLLCL